MQGRIWSVCKKCRRFIRGRVRRPDESIDPAALFQSIQPNCTHPPLPPGWASGARVTECLAGSTTVFVGNSNTREWLYALFELATGVIIARETQKQECEPVCGFYLPGGGHVVYIRAEPSILWAPQASSQLGDNASDTIVRAAPLNNYWLDEMVRLRLRPTTLVLGLGLGDAPSVNGSAGAEEALRKLLCLCRRLESEGTRVYLRTIPYVRLHPGARVQYSSVPMLFSNHARVQQMNSRVAGVNALLRQHVRRDMLLDEAELVQGIAGRSVEHCVFMDHIHAPPLMRASVRTWLGLHCPRRIFNASWAA